MELQRALDFEAGEKRRTALEETLTPYGLPHWSMKLLILLASSGRPREIADQQCLQGSWSKRNGAKELGCSPNTFAAAANDLRARGLLEVIDTGSRQRPRIYLLSITRVNQLAPIADDPLEELELFSRSVVSSGQCARVRSDEPHPAVANRSNRSGRLIDLDDETVRRRKLNELRPYFDDALGQGWLEDTHEDKRKFLALVHHAGSCRSIHHPAKVVYAGVRRYQFERINQVSWDWAGRQVTTPTSVCHIRKESRC